MAESVEQYKVAWVAAHECEKSASILMFDALQSEPSDFHRAPDDINDYTWGRIGSHDVVLSSRSAPPKVQSASSITGAIIQDMKMSLPHLRACLLVGTGSAIPGEWPDRKEVLRREGFQTRIAMATLVVPAIILLMKPERAIVVSQLCFFASIVLNLWSQKLMLWASIKPVRDIRLGDVIVNKPYAGNSNLVRYSDDMGSSKVQDDEPPRLQYLSGPPEAIASALDRLVTMSIENKIPRAALLHKAMLENNPNLVSRYERPTAKSDRLYLSWFRSDQAKRRGLWLSSIETNRESRASETLVKTMAGGVISSTLAETLYDTRQRDNFIRWHEDAHVGGGCLEFESAGIEGHVPCVSVRGITSYVDSHKQEGWEDYAAIMAATFAKGLLLETDPGMLARGRSIGELMNLSRHVFESANIVA